MRMVKSKGKMKRTQISLPAEELEAVQNLADRRKVSMSAFIRDAINKELKTQHLKDEQMFSIIGLGEAFDSHGSEDPDKLIYG